VLTTALPAASVAVVTLAAPGIPVLAAPLSASTALSSATTFVRYWLGAADNQLGAAVAVNADCTAASRSPVTPPAEAALARALAALGAM